MSNTSGMALGPYAFEVLGFSYESVSRKTNTSWADVPVAQTLNQLQWLGPTSDEITIKGVIFSEEFGGQGSLEGIRAAAMAGLPLMLVSGSALSGSIHGMHVIQSIDEDRSLHTAYGAPRRNAYSISLKRYSQDPASGALLNLFR